MPRCGRRKKGFRIQASGFRRKRELGYKTRDGIQASELIAARLCSSRVAEGQEHPGLGPAHVGDPVFVEGLDLVVEVPFPVPHVLHGPVVYGMGEADVALVEIPEGQKRDDALGHAVDVDGVCPVVEILRGAVLPEEVLAVEFEALADPGVEFRRVGVPWQWLAGRRGCSPCGSCRPSPAWILRRSPRRRFPAVGPQSSGQSSGRARGIACTRYACRACKEGLHPGSLRCGPSSACPAGGS